ncbi:MAG: S-ribosylhomocysteine lyase [Clostridia bacterium]|nr:S-ribosylhomocysteine lyase [Clostridia bacterium]MBR5365354.1 S-ribosylhomocysteine lyase [Clostridia bacterium]
MDRIASFTVDHDLLTPGIYVSRCDGDITTYDLRTRTPNAGDYMDNRTMHSVEHMFATFVRNSEIRDRVVYFGPMGCQTGFYLLTRGVPDEEVLAVTKDVLRKILAYDGPVFGASQKECGNYRNLDLGDAKRECARYLAVLESKDNDFRYATAAESE